MKPKKKSKSFALALRLRARAATLLIAMLCLPLWGLGGQAWAQETLTVYDGTLSRSFSPAYMYAFDWYTRSQYIIPAANLEAMNGKIITALKYYSSTSNKTSTCNVDVYLKEVSYTTFNSTPTFETKSGIVYTGTLSIAGDGTLTITFTTPYTYNGGNLLIGMENTKTGTSIYSSFYGQNVTGALAFGSSNSSLAAVTANRNDFIPKTTFTYETPPTAVDLGLPSGKKWADMNVGAGSATGYGTYYAWSSSDIATAQWGSNWRMPTKAEIEELKSYTDHEWATIGGVNGMKFMKKTDHSVYIFMPATGLNSSSEVGTIGYYWTSTEQSAPHAYFLYASSSSVITSYYRTKTDKLPIRPVQMFAGEGTESSPYLIASTADWNLLVSNVNGGETYSGKYFKMTANVGTVSTWMTGTFSGTFDGDGKTLTVNYSTSTNGCAPFGNLRAATIKNLIVDGTISTSGERAGGIAWWVLEGSMTYITNCRVAATINSTFSGGASTGGFVGSVQDYGTDGKLTITGCAFTGSLLGSSTHTCGGFVGWNGGTLTIENSLFAPASVTWGTSNSATFTRGGTVTNCYYTQKFNTAQGLQARTIAAGDYVSTLSVTKGSATATYAVSGITVYSGGIDFNDGSTTTFYGGSGQNVSLDLTPETRSGYQFKQYAASQGTLSGETTDTPTLTMPAANSTANDVVTISAEYDPLYNATFADGNDNDGWTIDPTSGVAGTSVTVSYTGENKVKSVTVTKLALCSLSEVTSEHMGKIIGADGNVYASLAQAEKVTSAVGVLGKVTETGHGLIMSLEDAPKQVWATIDGWASASYAGTTLKVLPDDDARGSNLPSYTTLGSTTVSNWAVATRADYTAIFTNLGSTGGDYDGISYDANMNAKITGAGGTAISGENWSSTQYDSSKAWRFASTWGGRNKTDQYKVRPVLGF